MDNDWRNGEELREMLLKVQFFVWILLISMLSLSASLWQIIVNYQALSNHPSLPLDVQESEHMMMIALIVLLSWGVPSGIAKSLLRKMWRLFFGVVDLAVVGFMITALVNRAQYFPTTLARCAQSHGSEPIAKLFIYVASVANENNDNDKGDDCTPEMACRFFLAEWVFAMLTIYIWAIPSILSNLNLSWNVTGSLLLLFFFPLPLFLGIYMRAFWAAYALFCCYLWLILLVEPPIERPLWHLSWPLRFIRYMARTRLKRSLKEKSCSGSFDLEKGLYAASPGFVFQNAGTDRTWVEPHRDFSNLSQTSNSKSEHPLQAGDPDSCQDIWMISLLASR